MTLVSICPDLFFIASLKYELRIWNTMILEKWCSYLYSYINSANVLGWDDVFISASSRALPRIVDVYFVYPAFLPSESHPFLLSGKLYATMRLGWSKPYSWLQECELALDSPGTISRAIRKDSLSSCIRSCKGHIILELALHIKTASLRIKATKNETVKRIKALVTLFGCLKLVPTMDFNYVR